MEFVGDPGEESCLLDIAQAELNGFLTGGILRQCS